MAHFTKAAVTDEGNELLNEMMAGRYVRVTRAAGGTGTVEEEKLHEQTGLQEEKQALAIIDDTVDKRGRTIAIQIANAEESYPLEQVGVFGKLEDEGKEKMIFILQDDDPITVPDTSAPTFMLNIYSHLNINNVGRFTVTIDKTGIVNIEFLERKLSEVWSIPGEGAPTLETVGKPGQHYFDETTGTEYICKKVNEDGTYVWEEAGSSTATGEGAPTPETVGKLGQHYFDEKTGVEYICKKVNEDGTYVWEESTKAHDKDQEAHQDIRWRLTNRNLLDNWYFADPINQRGETKWTITGDTSVYTIDRWLFARGSFELTAEGISIKYDGSDSRYGATVHQRFESIPKGHLTYSIIIDNKLYAVSFDYNGSDTGSIFLDDSNNFAVALNTSSTGYPTAMFRSFKKDAIVIKAIKLEIGDQQTLAHQDESGNWVLNDPPPDPDLELAKCKRYQQVYEKRATFGFRYLTDSGILIYIPGISLRAQPTIIDNGAILTADNKQFNVNTLTMTEYRPSSNLISLKTTAITGEGESVGNVSVLHNSPARFILDANL